MATTYDFGDLPNDGIITEAFEEIGIPASLITGQHLDSAQRSLNLIYTNLLNKPSNLWTIFPKMLELSAGAPSYLLPYNVSDIVGNELIITNATRVLGGTPYSSNGGTAANCFDPANTDGCIQTTENGYISYDYGTNLSVPVNYVGIVSLSNQNYQITIEYSFDNVTWLLALETNLQAYIAGKSVWFNLPAAVPARSFRIRETSGNTLAIQQLYFSVPQAGSRNLSRISRGTYLSMSNKVSQGSAGSFEVNRTLQASQLVLFGNGSDIADTYKQAPTLFLYLVPNLQFQFIIYNAYQYMPDVTDLQGSGYVPQRLLPYVTVALAAEMARKFNYERYADLRAAADVAFAIAAGEDQQRVPFTLKPMRYSL